MVDFSLYGFVAKPQLKEGEEKAKPTLREKILEARRIFKKKERLLNDSYSFLENKYFSERVTPATRLVRVPNNPKQ